MDDRDRDCLAELKKIEGLIRQFTKRSDVDVEQLAVDIWLELWLGHSRHRPTRWFVRARTIDAFREAKRRPVTNIEFGDRIANRPDIDVEFYLSCQELVNHLMELVVDARQRRIVYLRFYRGLSYKDIGREVGVGRETVRRQLLSILTRLRQAGDQENDRKPL